MSYFFLSRIDEKNTALNFLSEKSISSDVDCTKDTASKTMFVGKQQKNSIEPIVDEMYCNGAGAHLYHEGGDNEADKSLAFHSSLMMESDNAAFHVSRVFL